MEDIVITSYKQQIKESSLKADAIKSGGFDIVIEELEKRQVKTSKIKDFFSKIVNSYTMDDLNKLTLDDLEEVISDINQQVTQLLIAKVEIADAVIRKSKLVALAKSPDGKVSEKDNYVLVGNNLAKEINNDGVASGLELCIRNYCSQKIYQANYREKMVEKEKELPVNTFWYDKSIAKFTEVRHIIEGWESERICLETVTKVADVENEENLVNNNYYKLSSIFYIFIFYFFWYY